MICTNFLYGSNTIKMNNNNVNPIEQYKGGIWGNSKLPASPKIAMTAPIFNKKAGQVRNIKKYNNQVG